MDREVSYSSSVYQFLYGGYRLEAYFWEAVIMLPNVMLNVVLAAMATSPPLAQGLTVLFLLLVFLAIHVQFHPYENDKLKRIGTFSLLLATVTLFSGMYLFDDDVRKSISRHL